MKTNKSRKTRSKINYDETSPEPPPFLKYSKPKRSIQGVKTIGFPEYHHDRNRYYVEVTYWNDINDAIPEYLTILKACSKFAGSKTSKIISYKNWLLSLKTNEWMTDDLWNVIQTEITVTVTPKYSVGTFGLLIDDTLPSIISYIRIVAINSNLECHVDQIDDLLVYYVKHIDVRQNKITYFTVKSGKEFDLQRPRGWITQQQFLCITSPRYIAMDDVCWMQIQLQYFRLLAERIDEEKETVTTYFIETIQLLFEFMSVRVKGTLTLRNEGKIKSFTFYASKHMIKAVLNEKFRQIKELKDNEKFLKKGSSKYYLFNFQQQEQILGEEHVSRDYTEDGKEIFPDDMNDNDDDDEIGYTMSPCAMLMRFCESANKITIKHCVVRVDSNGDMYGQTLDFLKQYKSAFDDRDLKYIKINDENESKEDHNQ